jgi:hypothetical protein
MRPEVSAITAQSVRAVKQLGVINRIGIFTAQCFPIARTRAAVPAFLQHFRPLWFRVFSRYN